MAKPINKLSPLTVKSMAAIVKKEGKVEKATDGGGLYFVAEPSRSSWWRFDYRIGGKQKTLSIGTYPDIGGMFELRDDGYRKVRSDKWYQVQLFKD